MPNYVGNERCHGVNSADDVTKMSFGYREGNQYFARNYKYRLLCFRRSISVLHFQNTSLPTGTCGHRFGHSPPIENEATTMSRPSL